MKYALGCYGGHSMILVDYHGSSYCYVNALYFNSAEQLYPWIHIEMKLFT